MNAKPIITPPETNRKSTRNFSIGTRDMARAGKIFIHNSGRSFSTKGTVADRWNVFSKWSKCTLSIIKMEAITRDIVLAYGQHLNERVEQEELNASTAQLYISAVNTILKIATKGTWEAVSPTKDCGLPRRSHISKFSKAMPEARHNQIMCLVGERVAVLMGLQRLLGLRFKESALLDAKT